MKKLNDFLLVWSISLVIIVNVLSVYGYISNVQNYKTNNITWCTLNDQEQSKCLNLSAAVNRDRLKFNFGDFMELVCKQGFNKEDCMLMLDNNAADILSLDGGEVFIGGRYNSLIPLMQQQFEDQSSYYYAVALIKKNTLNDVYNLGNLKNKKACFAGVGTQAGWNIPINTLISKGFMKIFDCNNHVKTTIEFFGPSCAVNSLLDKYNPMGDNSDRLCTICASKISGQKCTWSDPYAGDEGAYRCLIESGDIAFLRHTAVLEMVNDQSLFSQTRESDLELLCVDGSRRPISDFSTCNWGSAPTDAIVTSSAKTSSIRILYQKWLLKIVELYGKPKSTTNNWKEFNFPQQFQSYDNSNTSFNLFDSSIYGNRHNLLLQDSTRSLRSIEESQQTYAKYLGDSMNIVMGNRYCPATRMTLCVTSEPEMDKCVKMKMELKVQLLVPEMQCFRGYSQVHCMQAIRNGNAGVAVMDAGDIYTAGLHYEEIPFITEMYDLPEPEYYVVAVAKEEDHNTELTYLKGPNNCQLMVFTRRMDKKEKNNLEFQNCSDEDSNNPRKAKKLDNSIDNNILDENNHTLLEENNSVCDNNKSQDFKPYRYIGDFAEEDLETPRRRKLFWNKFVKSSDDNKLKIRLLKQKNRRLVGKLQNLNSLVDELQKECQLSADYSHILKKKSTYDPIVDTIDI